MACRGWREINTSHKQNPDKCWLWLLGLSAIPATLAANLALFKRPVLKICSAVEIVKVVAIFQIYQPLWSALWYSVMAIMSCPCGQDPMYGPLIGKLSPIEMTLIISDCQNSPWKQTQPTSLYTQLLLTTRLLLMQLDLFALRNETLFMLSVWSVISRMCNGYYMSTTLSCVLNVVIGVAWPNNGVICQKWLGNPGMYGFSGIVDVVLGSGLHYSWFPITVFANINIGQEITCRLL